MSGCLSDVILIELIEQRIPDPQLAALQLHIDACPGCRQLVVEMANSYFASGDHAGGQHWTNPIEPGPESRAEPSRAINQWLPPETVDEFRVLSPLGHGTMGQVYLAHDTLLERTVAIKFIGGVEPDPASSERLLVEARAIARLQHPNVVTIYTVGEVRGRSYLVSEFVRGKSLDRLDKPLHWERVLTIALDLARGLAAAHRHGVLHRDIKPANAILTDEGQAKLLDFGLAKLLAPNTLVARPNMQRLLAVAELHLTAAGAQVGTPLYMSPEVWSGEVAGPPSDLYALGALLYELCTGQLPWSGATVQELRQRVLSGNPPSVLSIAPQLEIDPALGAVIDRCLRQQPQGRYESAEALYRALYQLTQQARVLPVPGGNPYRGLFTFEPQHRALFFGRDQDVEALLTRLRGDSLAIIASDSGVGKSSLCYAGILPCVQEGALADGRTWTVVSLMPGRDPLWALAFALSPVLQCKEEAVRALLSGPPTALSRFLRQKLGVQAGLLVFVDQMEELLTQSQPSDAVLFGASLTQLAARLPGVRVLCAVRGDFLIRLASILSGLGRELSRALYILRPLSREALREAIVGPAALKGVRFESEHMVTELLDSTSSDSGLPLLQFALSLLWEARDVQRKIIPDLALAQIGGVTGALSRHSDTVVQALLPPQRDVARRMLSKLVTAEDTRARRREAELLSADTGDRTTLDTLVRGRILVVREGSFEGGEYEIAHEALIKGWPTLRQWLSADDERRRTHQRLESAARDWNRTGRPRDILWGERQLAEVTAAGLTSKVLSTNEVDFLSAARKSLVRRRSLRLGLLLALPIIVGLLGSLSLAWYYAGRSRQIAEELAQAEMGARASSLAQQPGREIEALIAGLRAVAPGGTGHRPPPAAVSGLLNAVAVGRLSLPLREHRNTVARAAVSPDGRYVITVGAEAVGRVWDTATGALVLTLKGHTDFSIQSAEFSADGRRIVTAGEDKTARIWDARSGRELLLLRGHLDDLRNAVFSPDGRRIVTSSNDRTARIWNAETGALLATLSGHTELLLNAEFSPDGQRIVTSSQDRTARLWSAESGQLLATLVGHSGYLNWAAFSPDGLHIVTASADRTARVWEGKTGQPLRVLQGHTGPVETAAFSPDGASIVTASRDGTARVWEVTSGESLVVMHGHTQPLVAASFFPEGDRVLTASQDTTARIWDRHTGLQLAVLRGHQKPLLFAVPSADGRLIVTTSDDQTARLWSGSTGKRLNIMHGHTDQIWSARFSADSHHILTASFDGTARLWNGDTGQPIAVLRGHTGRVSDAAFSPDGERLLTTGIDGIGLLWTRRPVRQIAVLAGHTQKIGKGLFSPDGTRILTASDDHTLRLWDGYTGRPLCVLSGHQDRIWGSNYSPDGTRIAATSMDSTARLWDGRTCQPVAVMRGHTAPQNDVVFSHDSSLVVTVSDDHTARIWDGKTGQLQRILSGHQDEVWSADFSPDDQRLVTGSIDHTARLWDVKSGAPLAVLTGHTDKVQQVVYSPDGARIASGAFDRTVRLWDGKTGQALGTLRGHSSWIRMVSFSPDGRRLLTASPDGTARLWGSGTAGPNLPEEGGSLLLPVPNGESDSLIEAPHPIGDNIELSQAVEFACRLLRYQREFATLQQLCAGHLPP